MCIFAASISCRVNATAPFVADERVLDCLTIQRDVKTLGMTERSMGGALHNGKASQPLCILASLKLLIRSSRVEVEAHVSVMQVVFAYQLAVLGF